MRRYGPWTIKSSSTKFQNHFVTVTEDAVRQPDGSDGTYATVALNPGVAILAINDAGQVCLTRQFRYAIGRESIEVVSGAIDEGEEPLDAAKRELCEEVGLTAAEWSDVGTIDVDTSILRCPVRLFVARKLTPTSDDPDPAERIERLTVAFDAAVQMALNGAITHSPSCVLLLKAKLVG